MSKVIPLTKQVMVASGAHILYFYENDSLYFRNLSAFVSEGIERGDHLLIIDDASTMERLKTFVTHSYSPEKRSLIHFFDHREFYQCHSDFHTETIVDHFKTIIYSIPGTNNNIRTWARVVWMQRENIEKEIEKFEGLADSNVKKLGILSVCAYSAKETSASLQKTMMRSHEYLMTDEEFVSSSLFR
ncbi:MEDS: MEthanogen/methylotroph, DcmR Sensory domain [Thalassobacillus cyri]|uniref:MEDS: MEthanogen/methylotroph, DcmR Sensory domain n=1 Tax=Thalassobacillus cyri TaxID=571932 RepID=A0A1H3W4D1_9BACI|nr:MEDS domain-containing protein [Thalassobacillus cyri]SDZ81850.1 MEDS: MEthanogen/methylotroph, DcmR Sensory domain [Thalassobacillus cyri]